MFGLLKREILCKAYFFATEIQNKRTVVFNTAWGVMFQTLSLVLLSQAAEDTSRYLVKLNLKVWHSNEITALNCEFEITCRQRSVNFKMSF